MLGWPPILAHLVELVSLALISGVAIGVGLRLLNLLRLIPPPQSGGRVGVGGLSPGERLLFGFALGYGTLAYATFALGLLGLLYAPITLALLMLFAVVGFRPLLATLREAIPALRKAITGLRYPSSLFLALIILVTVIAALVKALVPPATQDDLMYHLALPARYVQQHAIAFYPDSSYSLFPQTMEMLYSVGLLFGSDRLAVLFSFVISLVGPAAAALFAKRYLGGDGAGVWRVLPLLTAALFLTTPLVGFILRAANTDPPQASFDLLAGYAAYLAIANRASAEGVINHAPTKEGVINHAPTKEGVMNHAPTKAQSHQTATENSNLKPQTSALMLSGVCAGLALAVKYNGFAVGLAIGLALVAVIVYRRLSLGSGVRLLLAYGLPIALLIAPWLARNWVASGNPVWPLASDIFGGVFSSPASSPAYLLGNAPPPGLSSLSSGWEFIINAITRPPLAIDNQLQVVSLGPLLLPLLLLLPLAKWRPALRWVIWLAAAYWLLWALFFSRTSARYLTSFFLFTAILSADAVIALAARARLLQWALGGVIAFALTVLALDTILSAADYLPATVATDPAAEQQYLTRYMEDYPMMQYLAASTPLTATIYVWDGQPRGYYIPRRYVYARLVPLYSDFGDSDLARWRTRLGELGVTYVLYHPRATLAPSLAPGYDPAAAAANAFSARYFGPPLFQSGPYTLYPLR
jgi:Protein of unknown function (DUF1420)